MLLPFQRSPLFLAHGTEDEKVRFELGLEARDCLLSLQVEVDWKKYEGLGHGYSDQMLGDLVHFLDGRTGWTGKSEVSVKKILAAEEMKDLTYRLEAMEKLK